MDPYFVLLVGFGSNSFPCVCVYLSARVLQCWTLQAIAGSRPGLMLEFCPQMVSTPSLCSYLPRREARPLDNPESGSQDLGVSMYPSGVKLLESLQRRCAKDFCGFAGHARTPDVWNLFLCSSGVSPNGVLSVMNCYQASHGGLAIFRDPSWSDKRMAQTSSSHDYFA